MIRVDKETTKLPVVYDASARAGRNSPSLNDCLHAGPPLSLYMGLRMNEIAITGDIEKAFLNVSVDPSNQDYLRFLWVDDVTSRHPNIQVYRFARDAFHVSPSPFLLNATVRHHLTSTDIPREFADKVLKSLYVASFVGGDDSDDCVFEMYKELMSSFIDAGFNEKSWSWS